MKRKLTALLTALLLALALCVPASAAAEYGVVYDETEVLGSPYLEMQGEEMLPELSETLGIELRVDVLRGMDYDSIADAAVAIYENFDYGFGEEKEGVTLTILMELQDDGSYAMPSGDSWCVYARLSEARGSGQELANAIRDVVAPYMAERAWNGEDITMSGVALTQAIGCMAAAVSDYFGLPGDAGEDLEPQGTEPDGVDMHYIFDHSDLLSFEQWAELEARAEDISLRHGCGIYAAFVDDFTEYGGGDDVYETTYQLYHAGSLGMGEGRDGVIILLSMEERDYAMFIYGEQAEYAFDRYGAKQLEDRFLSDFGDNDWYTGLSHYLAACDEFLALAEEGKPVRSSPLPFVALIVCLILKGQMKSVRKGVEANVYAVAGGLALTDSYDHYTHTTESRTKIVDESSKSGGGGGSTTSRSGGGGHGRSGKF